MEDKKFNYLKLCVSDMVANLCYYDRKECEEVSSDDILTLTDEQIQELTKFFNDQLRLNK